MSEYDDTQKIQNVIASQFPAAMLINYVPENTSIVAQADSNGYINGFAAQYLVDTVTVSDGINTSQAAILGYALDVPGAENAGKHLFISMATTNITQKALDACSVALSACIKTLTVDSDKAAELKKELEDKANAISSEGLSNNGIDLNNVSSAETNLSENSFESGTLQSDVTVIQVQIPYDYNDLTVTVNFTENNNDAIMELFLPDGQSFASPSDQTETGGTFTFQKAVAGTYNLRVKNYRNCGDISYSISGNASE